MRLVALARLADRVIGGPSLSPSSLRRFHGAADRIGSSAEPPADDGGDVTVQRAALSLRERR